MRLGVVFAAFIGVALGVARAEPITYTISTRIDAVLTTTTVTTTVFDDALFTMKAVGDPDAVSIAPISGGPAGSFQIVQNGISSSEMTLGGRALDAGGFQVFSSKAPDTGSGASFANLGIRTIGPDLRLVVDEPGPVNGSGTLGLYDYGLTSELGPVSGTGSLQQLGAQWLPVNPGYEVDLGGGEMLTINSSGSNIPVTFQAVLGDGSATPVSEPAALIALGFGALAFMRRFGALA